MMKSQGVQMTLQERLRALQEAGIQQWLPYNKRALYFEFIFDLTLRHFFNWQQIIYNV